jgi:N-acetylmuramoyl-L-alanine amidase
MRTRALLMQAGFEVKMTRTSDTFIPLYDRTRYANEFPNALFISIHFNSGGAGTGLETYTLAPRGVPSMMADGPRISDLENCAGNANDAQNMALATATHASLVVRSRMYDRGIKRARFVVIRDIKIPGVLIEGGFLSNIYDARLVASGAYRQQMASCILQAVQNYRRAVGTQIGEVAARAGDAPRIQTNAPTLRIGPSQNDSEPVVVPTAPATN